MPRSGHEKRMVMKKMLVFVNFTEASMRAVKQAAVLSEMHGGVLHICHVSNEAGDREAQQKLKEYTRLVEEAGGKASILTGTGDFFEEAPALAKSIAPDLVIIGAVGMEGFSTSHFGSSIYKLVRSLPFPALVLQRNAALSANGYRNALLPLSAHPNFNSVVKALPVVMASGGLVTLLVVTVQGADPDETFMSNAASAEKELDRLGIKHTLKKTDVSKITSGYAGAILGEMAKEDMDLIAMPADVAKRSQHFGKMDKEALLSNAHGYPVFCLNSDIE